jgi:membrane-associated phospholipid phosphatase
MTIYDILSLSIIFIYIIPLILYIITYNIIHMWAFLGVISTTLISETIKLLIIGNSNPRPAGAINCNLFCNDGNQSGKPGMPSSHSASVAFFSGFYYQQTDNKYIRIGLIIYTGLVILSRYLKRCHTISQVLVGAILGMSLSLFIVRHI